MTIEPLTKAHWPGVKTICQQGISSGHATFQTVAPDWEEWDAHHVVKPRLVATENNRVCGWAALTPVSGRSVYSGVGEVSI